MSRWAKVIIQERSDYALDVAGQPEVAGRKFIWNVELQRFDDFVALRHAVLAHVLASQESYNEQRSDEKELTIRYVMRTQQLTEDHPTITRVGKLCATFSQTLV